MNAARPIPTFEESAKSIPTSGGDSIHSSQAVVSLRWELRRAYARINKLERDRVRRDTQSPVEKRLWQELAEAQTRQREAEELAQSLQRALLVTYAEIERLRGGEDGNSACKK